MNSVSKSKVSRAMVALGVAGVLLAAIAPADAHKKLGNQGGKKPPENQGPIGPLPKPPAGPIIGQGQWHATPTRPVPVVVRDHRTQPEVRDHRTNVRDHRGGQVPAAKKTPCLGNLCGAIKTAKQIAGGKGPFMPR